LKPLALSPQTWLVIGILVIEAAALVVVVAGLMSMLGEDGPDSGG
jgi:hypothetical protein